MLSIFLKQHPIIFYALFLFVHQLLIDAAYTKKKIPFSTTPGMELSLISNSSG